MALYLAFEGGGSSTRAGLFNEDRDLLAETVGLASNPVDIGVDACVRVLISLGRDALGSQEGKLTTVAAGIAGASNPAFRDEIAKQLSVALGVERAFVTDDLRPLLLANAYGSSAILAIAGTGSSVLAQSANGETIIVGGRGPVFGDEGSAYQIAVSALRIAARAVDGMAPHTRLVEALPRCAGVSSFAEFAVWARAATKRRLANLAVTVSQLALEGDVAARECVETQAQRLAEQVLAARRRLSRDLSAQVFMSGGMFDHCPLYRESFVALLERPEIGMRPEFPKLRGPCAVVELCWLTPPLPNVSVAGGAAAREDSLPATECTIPSSVALDRLTARGIVDLMNAEDARLAPAVFAAADTIAAVIDVAANAIRVGGRIIYVGAGTSGRLGVLDASECPPTFGVSPERVTGVIAGGARALRESVEGVEDDAEQAARDMNALSPQLNSADLVVGVAASGVTPYVLAALDEARTADAHTALVSCNPASCAAAEFVIFAETGPEVLVGSTRLKAGTATKMILNMISTGAMALAGYVYEGQMVGIRPINTKLRRRAIRIITSLTGVSEQRSEQLLDATGGSIPEAVIMVRLGLDAASARERLESARTLRVALESPSS